LFVCLFVESEHWAFVFFLLVSCGLSKSSFHNVVNSVKMDSLNFITVIHVNRHLSHLFIGKGETGKPKFQNSASHVDGSL